jgi:hypothetical protein
MSRAYVQKASIPGRDASAFAQLGERRGRRTEQEPSRNTVSSGARHSVSVSFETALRRLAWRLTPGLMAERARDWERQLRQRAGVTALAERFIAEHGSTVRDGPFAGLVYPVNSISSVDAPIAKLLGAYERELHPALDEAIRAKPRGFVDIGCADGYYAAGFANASTPTTVFAFDVSRSARELCRELAELNGVGDRVLIAGRATARALQSVPLQDSVVLSDCEGAEKEIFTRSFIRRLGSVVAIIELHEAIKPGIESLLRHRFCDSHTCEMVTTRPRRPAEYPALQNLTPADRELALTEWREPSSRWAIFRPRH